MIIKSRKYNDLSDADLIQKYQRNGNSKWVGALFSRYAHLVFGSALKYLKNESLAKDAVMQIFEKLLTELKKGEVESFRSWLFVVSRNHCFMILRSRKNKEIEMPEYVELQAGTTEDYLEKEEEFERLEQAMDQLKEEQARCIRLFYFKKMSYAEISKHTGWNLKKVKSLLQNGKRNLQIIMKEHYGRA